MEDAPLVGKLDVVSGGADAPETVDRARFQQPLLDDFVQQLAAVVVELLRARLLEDLREAPAQLPRLEERRPVDERLDALERHVVEHARAEERRPRRLAIFERRPAAPRLVERKDRDRLARRLRVAELLVFGAHRGGELAFFLAEQRRHDADGARGVEHVHGRFRVARGDAHRGVELRRRRAADEQRDVKLAPLHLPRHMDHLVE